jgi:hypothetical protein
MRTVIKVEDGEGEVQLHKRQRQEAEAGCERSQHLNHGAAAAGLADGTQSLLAALAASQAQAFVEMENARVMGLELQQAKADVARLQAEAKVKDEACRAKEILWQAIIRSKDDNIESKDQLLQANILEICRLHADLAGYSAKSAANIT